MASLTGPPAAIAELIGAAELPAHAQVVGPVPVDRDSERMLIRVPRSAGADLAHRLKEAAAGRSARRSAEPVRIQLDPHELI
jgi:primosomal protein N' (replication factor Y)